METAVPAIGAEPISTGFTRKLVEDWVNSCNDFLRWQRREIIERRPSPARLAEHRDTLKVMLRLGRSLHAQVSDPDFPRRQCVSEVGGKLRQLEKSWEMIHNPMGDGEAEAVLQRAFPDEPGTGSAA
jgi:hypothetical protein